MSSKARRIDAANVEPFSWVESATPGLPATRSAPAASAAPPPAAGDAKQQAAAETADLDARRAAVEREAFAKGFAQGEKAGAEAAGKRGEVMLRRLTETLSELTNLRTQMIHQTEHQMVQLALAVARRVVHREISLDRDLLVAMARVALDRLGESAQVTVRLCPDDFEVIVASRLDQQWAGTNVTVVADPRVSRGGCRIESDLGVMDAGADAQIQEIARALLGESAEQGAPGARIVRDGAETGARVVSS
jgi:flagellar assembly protein FliH